MVYIVEETPALVTEMPLERLQQCTTNRRRANRLYF